LWQQAVEAGLLRNGLVDVEKAAQKIAKATSGAQTDKLQAARDAVERIRSGLRHADECEARACEVGACHCPIRQDDTGLDCEIEHIECCDCWLRDLEIIQEGLEAIEHDRAE
jgi:hypothetical protein